MQHIQMAVQAGYLNPQILNQPLAPTTLMLLNNMLSHINVLQKFSQQQALWQAQAHLNKNSSTTLLQLNINITKTKQQIQNLQVRHGGGGGGGRRRSKEEREVTAGGGGGSKG